MAEIDVTHDERMDRISEVAMRVAEDVWTDDEPSLAEYELAQVITEKVMVEARLAMRAERERDPSTYNVWSRVSDVLGRVGTSPAPSPREAEICTCGAWSDRNLAHPPGCPALEHIPPDEERH